MSTASTSKLNKCVHNVHLKTEHTEFCNTELFMCTASTVRLLSSQFMRFTGKFPGHNQLMLVPCRLWFLLLRLESIPGATKLKTSKVLAERKYTIALQASKQTPRTFSVLESRRNKTPLLSLENGFVRKSRFEDEQRTKLSSAKGRKYRHAACTDFTPQCLPVIVSSHVEYK